MARRVKKASKKKAVKKKASVKEPNLRPTPTPRPDADPVPAPKPDPRPKPPAVVDRDPDLGSGERPWSRDPNVRPSRIPDFRRPKPGEQPKEESWAEIEQLDPETPLLLMPVQLETIFDKQDGKPALKVRVYPDTVSIDSLTRGLRPQEMEAGNRYWAAKKNRREALKLEMVERFGVQRAAWAAEATRPDAAEKPYEAKAEEPARPALLPYRWIVRGYLQGEVVFTQPGEPIATGLTMSPSPDAKPWKDAPAGLPVDENTAWTVNYERAVAQGMAVTIELDDLPEVADNGLDFLFVFGVREDVKGTTEELERLFDAHHFTHGLEMLAQGVPTNNTEDGESGWSAHADERLFERMIESPDRHRDGAKDGLFLAQALGLGKFSTLARAIGAGRGEQHAAADMNEVLWPTVWGEYLGKMLSRRSGRALPQSAVRFARNWFLQNVRGGAPLPALRVGEQPYGVLPVRAAVERPKLATNQEILEDLLRVLRELWLDAAPNLARIDPNLSDTGGQANNSPESRLAEMFMLQPHAVRFVIRRLTDRRDQGPLLGYITSLVGGFTFLLDVLCSIDLYQGFGNIYRQTESHVETIDDQIAGFEFLRDFAPTYFDRPGDRTTRDNAIVLVDLILDILRAHKSRQPPLNALEGITTSGVLHEDVDDPTIFYGLFDKDEEARVFERALVQVAEPQDSETAASYLENLAQRANGKAPGGGPPPAPPQFPQGAPLLYQLLDPFVTTLPNAQRTSFARALRRLSNVPADELELRLRETLGLGSYRIDAWFTSLARKRLFDARNKTPEGLAAGGFGCVVDLKPSKARKASQGFIHAPSQAQAVTAAVLRSGWSAHGTQAADSPLAVNLESSRVRTARWLLDGVRQGQAPGDLLGARIERRLHDLHLDHHIDPLRRRALQAAGKQHPPRGPVDGIELRNLFVAGELNDLTNSDAELEGVLRELDAWLDSAVDAGTAESVHQLTAGNMPRAAAMLRSINTGDTRPPQLEGLETPRRGPVVENRVLALLESTSSAWPAGPRARVAPELESWCASLLGNPRTIGCLVQVTTPKGDVMQIPVSMSDLGISALDAVFESELGAATAWQARAEELVRRKSEALEEKPSRQSEQAIKGATFRAALGSPGRFQISMQEAAETAAALHAMLGRSRPLRPSDLAQPGEEPDAEWDVASIEARAKALANEAGNWFKKLHLAQRDSSMPVETLRQLVLEGLSFGGPIASAAAAAASPDADLTAVVGSTLRVAEKTVAEANKLQRSAGKADNPALAYREAVGKILGKGFPIPCAFTLPVDAPFAGALGRDQDLLDDREDGEIWLRQTSRVRATTQSLREARDLASLLGVAPEPLRVAQLPVNPGERWAALHRPQRGTGGRVSFLLVGDASAGRRFSGLALDSWSERVPDSDQITGVAFHHDSPSARPPQTLLLAVTPEGEKWSLELLCSTLLQTLELAQLRCVSPADLGDWGHHLPAIHSPHSISVEAVEAD